MNDAVVVTEWYVVREEARAGAGSLAIAGQPEPPRLASATAGPTWAWFNGPDDVPRWRGVHPLTAKGGAYLFALPSTGRVRADAARGSSQSVVLPMAPALLHAMSLAAEAQGRAEGEIWAEAAREWLARHREDDPEPPTPAASAPTRRPVREGRLRGWSAVDVLLRDLRAPVRGTTDDEPAA